MEKIQNLPEFDGVYDSLGKVDLTEEDSPIPEKLELEDPKKFNETLLTFTGTLLPKWKSTNETTATSIHTQQFESSTASYFPLGKATLDAKAGIHVVAEKKIVIGKNSKGENFRTETLRLNLYKEDGQPISDIALFQGENSFEINHRVTRPQFRRQGFGKMLLKAGEEMVKNAATDTQKPQITFANASQLDVIYWFWDNGYRPASDKDWENLQKILAGDPALCLTKENYIFEKNTPRDQWYYTDEGEQRINFNNAFRIRMKHEFPPNPHADVQDVIKKTKQKAAT